MEYKEVLNCRVCNSTNLRKYLELGNVPLANSLLIPPYLQSNKYPIQVLFCSDCCLSQLSIVVDPKILYSEYAYHSSVSQTFKDHCFNLGKKLKEDFNFDFPLVVDIASNDGCLLREFRKVGFERLMGIDPANNFATNYQLDEKEKFQTDYISVKGFFSEKMIKSIDGSGGTAHFITATNVLAHIDDLDDFLKGVHWILADNGVFVVEVPYLYNLLKHNQFDTIYHEHLSYFLLKPLIEIFHRNGLPIFRVEEYPIHGGSIRIYASKGYYTEERSVEDMLEFEYYQELYKFSTYEKFSEKVNKVREDLIKLLVDIERDRKMVIGYGASAKGISLLNYCGIKQKYITYIVDDTKEKQGKFTPGSEVPIVDKRYFNYQPEYILLLPWNFSEELMAKTKHLGAKYIIPIPEVRVI